MASADPHGAVSGAPLPPGLKPAPSHLDIPLHVSYIEKLANSSGSLGYHLTTHLRLNAIYWAVAALHLLGKPDTLDRDDLLKFVMSCWDDDAGAFGSYPRHDAHILSTLSAIQVLAIKDALHLLDEGGKRDRLVKYILALQDPQTGAFSGDTTHLEQDTRFLYCALQALAILSSPHSTSSSSPSGSDINRSSSSKGPDQPTPLSQLDRELTISHVLACRNFDGCFGTTPGSESHAGQAFVCTGALCILGALDRLDEEGSIKTDKAASKGGSGTWGNSATATLGGLGGDAKARETAARWKGRDRLATWLAQRQLPCGGLNGRPQKLEDVCYSWWVLSALAMLGRLHWINAPKLESFILSAQDPDNGGISDRPGNVADVFHTLFGVAGISLLSSTHAKGLQKVDPVFCLPEDVSRRLGLAGRLDREGP